MIRLSMLYETQSFAIHTTSNDHINMTTFKLVKGYKDIKAIEVYYGEDYRFRVCHGFTA